MQQQKNIKEDILSVLGDSDILLIVPPFASIKTPLLALHILQSTAEKNGYKTDILYLNILLASIIGVETAEALSVSSSFLYWRMLGERLFARSAYHLAPLGKSPGCCTDEAMSVAGNNRGYVKTHYGSDDFDLDTYKKVEAVCASFIDMVVPAIASSRYKIIGCTACMGQTNCSIAVLQGIKHIRPDIITIIGGASCDGEMAEGIASLNDSIDYVFSGESEDSFTEFLTGCSQMKFPGERIIPGRPLHDLNTLQLPDYSSFFKQIEYFLGKDAPRDLGVFYESSRGCWWGEKEKCRFCGIKDVVFRWKKPQKVLNDLEQISKRYPGKLIAMADNIMPPSFQQELVPQLKNKKTMAAIFYRHRPNLELKELIHLKAAKIDLIYPGIETLSTGLLKLVNKGITAGDNIHLLRCARSVGINLYWIMLWGFPGDKAVYYEEILELMPLLRHLQPPADVNHLQLERFSAYHQNPAKYQITNLRPWAVYDMIYPERAKKDKLAYYFAGDYPCDSHSQPGLIRAVIKEWKSWKKDWPEKTLVLVPFKDYYRIYDNRNSPGKNKEHILDDRQAGEIMTTCVYKESAALKWALAEKLGVLVDSRYIPLVTASTRLLLKFEEKYGR